MGQTEPKRAEDIRRSLGVGDDIPVIELHIVKGLDAKSYIYAIIDCLSVVGR